MIIKEYRGTKNRSCLICGKRFYGFGCVIDTWPPYTVRELLFTVQIKFFFIQFWWDRFK